MSGRSLITRIRAVPGLGRDALVVAAIVTVGLVVLGVLLANQQVDWPGQSDRRIVAEFVDAPSVQPDQGQEVRIAGVPVGEIVGADLSDHGTALLTLAVRTDDVIYDNARLVLRPKSPLNETYVTIAPGGSPAAPLAENAVIPPTQTSQPVPVDDVLSHLDVRTRDALGAMLGETDVALANFPKNLPPGLRAADGTLTGIRPVVDSLATRDERIRTLVSSLSQIARVVGDNDVRLARVAQSLQTTLGVVARNDDEFHAALGQLPDVTARLRSATSEVSTLSGQLDPTLDSLNKASAELPGSLDGLRDTVDRIDTTLDVAGPLFRSAKPVVGDLRPLVSDLRGALVELKPTTGRLERITAGVVPYLPDLKAFAGQTASVASLRDSSGGFFRAQAVVSPGDMAHQVGQALQAPPAASQKGPQR